MQRPPPQKPVLFYSRFCKHSTDAIRAVSVRGLGEAVAVACIDGVDRNRLPAWVDRVPILFSHDRRVLFDDALLSYIASYSPRLLQQQQQGHQQQQQQGQGPAADGGGDPMAAEVSGGTSYTPFGAEDAAGGAASDVGAPECRMSGSSFLAISATDGDGFPSIASSGSGGGDDRHAPAPAHKAMQYNPNEFAPPRQPPGSVPGRGMVATFASGSSEPPPRMPIPMLTSGGMGGGGMGGGMNLGSAPHKSMMESIIAAREQDDAQWMPARA